MHVFIQRGNKSAYRTVQVFLYFLEILVRDETRI